MAVRVLVVGAGIAGLSAALRLRQLGWSPTVVETAPGPRGGGYMIDFFGPGLDAADRLGLRPALERIHAPIERLVFVDGSGRPRVTVGYPALRRRAFGGRHHNFLRGDLEAELYAAARDAGVQLSHGRKVTGVQPAAADGDPVLVRYADGAEEEWDVVLGADGIHSRVRDDLLERDEWSTRDLGHAVWAWLLDGSLRSVRREDFVTLTAPGRMVAVYPVDEGRTAAFFVHRSPDGGGEHGADLPGTLHDRFGDLGWLVPELLAALPSAVDRYTDRTVQVRARVWHRGRVALLGDACWCVSLLAGQGASLAMTGGVAVAEELATVSAVTDVPAALDRVRNRLGPPVARLAEAGARTASWFVPEERWRMTVRDTSLRASAWPVVGPVLGRRFGLVRPAA
ncbi:2-polyprenyl-6-methoxyphenol hydroxylase [Geodermatophilus africanus]|uniref:2-polyprenyl-6-methoxyphenol hydroxylase n=1 Tax=Geodermatophilus africanus TaxID=1137993 RepID=A0A1H3PIJ8_9ACTN|nr:FAD-dependent oxidoreductase [Geodermatophilus africanus]SDZ00887.1 2-polyprenyl-6-methoxyphenol hydroxylase [Geodermatophilus africanus]